MVPLCGGERAHDQRGMAIAMAAEGRCLRKVRREFMTLPSADYATQEQVARHCVAAVPDDARWSTSVSEGERGTEILHIRGGGPIGTAARIASPSQKASWMRLIRTFSLCSGVALTDAMRNPVCS